MRIVIVGAGVVGFHIAESLIAEGNDVVLIEKNPERAKYVSSHLDCIVINDEGNNVVSLKNAGIENADFFISVTNSDEVNMIMCGIVSSEFNVPVKIARVRNLDYSKARKLEFSMLGIDFIVNSEVETARQIANTVALGATSDVMLFENTELQMRNIIVDSMSFFMGKSLRELKKSIKSNFLISAILRKDTFIIPSGDTVIQENDNIYFFATKNNLTKIFMDVGRKSEKIDKIILVGGGKIGTLVCQYLIRTGRKISIVEKNYEECKMLAEKFPEALVINADISEEDIFEEEQFGKYDLIITATNNQELNILSAVYAKSLGTRRALALVAKSNYIPIAARLAIDTTINPKTTTVDAILKFVRRGDIKSVHSLFGGKAEVIQFSVEENTHIPGMKIHDLHMPENSLILSVSRDNEDIIPDGNFEFMSGDSVIAIVKKESIKILEENL